ncbi:universal stress protein [Segetibacter koreensis]|uniref:universal stress protein n=1 Tax=Segetibacter koreensis TaxID=398037 RepID=UPI000378547E|nr:universal stress protein [Segetibacter koreensis]
METLLIATDFLSVSHNAAAYGVKLAAHLGADVVLFNAYQSIISPNDTVVVIPDEEVRAASESRLQHELNSLTIPEGVKVETLAEQGWTTNAILSAAKKVNAKWIIAGIKQSGVTGRKFFGSTDTELSRHTSCPLILIPDGAKFTEIKNIALASDREDETMMRLLDPLHEFGQKFGSRMFVVRVIKKEMDEVMEILMRPSLIESHFKDLKPVYEFEVDNNVAHAMNKFVKEHNVDMIVMVKQDHPFLERLFTKSNTKEMIFEANIPLIILPGKLDTAYPVDEESALSKKQ